MRSGLQEIRLLPLARAQAKPFQSRRPDALTLFPQMKALISQSSHLSIRRMNLQAAVLWSLLALLLELPLASLQPKRFQSCHPDAPALLQRCYGGAEAVALTPTSAEGMVC